MEQFFQRQDLGAIAPELELAMFGMIVLIAGVPALLRVVRGRVF